MSACIEEILVEAAALGIKLRLDGNKVKAAVPSNSTERLKPVLEQLRSHRDEVRTALQQQVLPEVIPPGVRLVSWSPKPPPIALESCSIVIDPELFARTTLEQLRVALAEPKRWVGWSVPQLIDRLAQVGVLVALDRPTERND